MEIITNQALISINETAIVQLVSFLIFLLIFKRIMFRPLRKAVSEREGYIEKAKKEIVAAYQKNEEFLNRLEEHKAAVRDEAYKINRNIEQEAEEKAKEMFVAARQEITTLKADAEKEFEAQIAVARKKLEKESESLVSIIIDQVLKRRLAA